MSYAASIGFRTFFVTRFYSTAYAARGIWAARSRQRSLLHLGSPKRTMKRLVIATLLHVASTNNCERATDAKPAHICRAAINADALRGAIPDAADALPLHGGTPPSLSIELGRVDRQKARLLRKADTTGAPLVWVLDDYVGIGNALDAYVRAVIEARHRGRSLVIKSPILRNLCRIVGVRRINQIVDAPDSLVDLRTGDMRRTRGHEPRQPLTD